MTAFIVLATYLAIGGVTAGLSLRTPRQASGAARARAAAFALLLWPYTLPFMLQGPPRPAGTHTDATGRGAEIQGREQRLEQALKRADGAADIDLTRVAGLAARLGRRLRHLDERGVALEAAIAEAPASVRAPLEALHESCQDDLAGGLRLMDELTGKLTLLAFANLGDSRAHVSELDEVRSLLSRLEAMASATREVAAVGT
mgnify:CR=1 FL=1